MLLIPDEIGEVLDVLEGKFQRFQGMIEAQQADGAGELPRGAEQRERICGGAEANVPHDEFTGVSPYALDQPKLADVEGLRLRHGADDRVKGLVVRQRVNAMRAIAEPDYAVAGGEGH